MSILLLLQNVYSIFPILLFYLLPLLLLLERIVYVKFTEIGIYENFVWSNRNFNCANKLQIYPKLFLLCYPREISLSETIENELDKRFFR